MCIGISKQSNFSERISLIIFIFFALLVHQGDFLKERICSLEQVLSLRVDLSKGFTWPGTELEITCDILSLFDKMAEKKNNMAVYPVKRILPVACVVVVVVGLEAVNMRKKHVFNK